MNISAWNTNSIAKTSRRKLCNHGDTKAKRGKTSYNYREPIYLAPKKSSTN